MKRIEIVSCEYGVELTLYGVFQGCFGSVMMAREWLRRTRTRKWLRRSGF